MARYKHSDIENGQGLFLSVNLKDQLLPGTFEYMLDDLVGTKIDLSIFDGNYKNDGTGATAIPPVALIKLIIYGYSKGIKSSRKLMALNSENIIAKALTRDLPMHWTTIADFISENGDKFKDTFIKVLAYCNELGLIGGETFAIDGVRLPSNASLDQSGTKKQLEKRVEAYRKMAEKHVRRHKEKDSQGEVDEELQEKFEKRQQRLNQRMAKIEGFLAAMKIKEGKGGQEIQSNVTDNESAMIHSSKGFVQGYIGVAVSDQKNQIIVSAQAVGTANEGEHLPAMLDSCAENMQSIAGKEAWEGKTPTVLGDTNYFGEENFRACEVRGIEAIIPGANSKRLAGPSGEQRFEAQDFTRHEEGNYYECPWGKSLPYKGTTMLRVGEGAVYQASLTDCKVCPHFSRCMWTKKEQCQIVQGRKLLITERNDPSSESLCNNMREKMNTEECQARYAQRIQIIEPVFANIRYCKGLNRFMLRGKEKVNGQWRLYCIVHNLGKCLNEYNERRESA